MPSGHPIGAIYMFEMGSYPLLPIIRLMGINFMKINLYSKMENGVDVYTRGVVRYPHGVCSFQLGLGVKTEGNLVIAGTNGYAYVPAPWWLTDYYEFRFEDQNQNKKFFYKWDGAGLRYEIQEFISCIVNHRFSSARLRRKESIAIADIMQQFVERKNFMEVGEISVFQQKRTRKPSMPARKSMMLSTLCSSQTWH